jgi:hypothetical protein
VAFTVTGVLVSLIREDKDTMDDPVEFVSSTNQEVGYCHIDESNDQMPAAEMVVVKVSNLERVFLRLRNIIAHKEL